MLFLKPSCICDSSAANIDKGDPGENTMNSLRDSDNSERNIIKNIEILKHGFLSMKMFATDRVKDIENMIRTFEEKSAIERGKVLVKFNELAAELSKLNQTLDTMQNFHSLSMEVF